jgi:hypothetical protein
VRLDRDSVLRHSVYKKVRYPPKGTARAKKVSSQKMSSLAASAPHDLWNGRDSL